MKKKLTCCFYAEVKLDTDIDNWEKMASDEEKGECWLLTQTADQQLIINTKHFFTFVHELHREDQET